MKIQNKTLMVTFGHDVTVGNAIEATLIASFHAVLLYFNFKSKLRSVSTSCCFSIVLCLFIFDIIFGGQDRIRTDKIW